MPKQSIVILTVAWLVVAGGVEPARSAAGEVPSDAGRFRDALARRLADGRLSWGGDVEGGAPFQVRDPDDPRRVIGFEVELADLLAKSLSQQAGRGIAARFVQYEWVSLPLGLRNRDFDCIISGFEVTADRRQQFRLSRPYYRYSQQLVVRRDEQQIHGMADLRGRSVGTLSGSAADRLLHTAGVTDIVGFDGQVEPYLDLELGRLDAVLLDLPIAIFYARDNPRLRFVPEQIGPGFYAIGLRRDDELLCAAIDRALGEIFTSGDWVRVLRRWHLLDDQQATLASGANRAAELEGLGFDTGGRPRLATKTAGHANGGDVAAGQIEIATVAAAGAKWSFREYAPVLAQAALMTVFLSASSMAVAITLGLAICVARLYGPRPLRYLALGYVEFFRGIPLLLLLFFLYFGLSSYGLALSALATAIVGFGLTYGAYEAEIYRSAILSVPSGQWEAGLALGMPGPMIFRRIIFPQAVRTALAPITNDFVALFKDTSLVSVIAVRELTKEYLILSRSSLQFVELGLLTAALYLMMSLPLGYLSRYLEQRWGAPR